MIKIMLIKICPREKDAPLVQQILTDFGDIIKARLGLHNVDSDASSSTGLIILHLKGEDKHDDEVLDLKKQLKNIEGVTVQLQEI